MPDNPRQAAVDALMAERYGRATGEWFKAPERCSKPPEPLDSELDIARRRRVLIEAYDHDERQETG